jgi:hypothetical protein
MSENVLFRPSGDIEQRTRREEVETGLRERRPVFALEPLVKLFLERMQIPHVAGGIFPLRLAELVRSPVARLLLLGNVDVQQLLYEVLEPVAIGVRPDQPRGGARAVDRRGHNPEIRLHDAEVEAREMVELQPLRIG